MEKKAPILVDYSWLKNISVNIHRWPENVKKVYKVSCQRLIFVYCLFIPNTFGLLFVEPYFNYLIPGPVPILHAVHVFRLHCKNYNC